MHWRTSLETESKNRAGGFFSWPVLIPLLLCAGACAITTGTLLAFLRPEVPAKLSHRTLTFTERVTYQRAIEGVTGGTGSGQKSVPIRSRRSMQSDAGAVGQES